MPLPIGKAALQGIRDACYMTLVTAMPRAGLPMLSAIPVPGNRAIPPLRQRLRPTGIDDERC
jgi:hypothetical protein